jgi:PDZ domain/C2 domain
MRTLSLCLLLSVCLCGACAFPRRTTLMHPAPQSTQPLDPPDNLWSIRFVDAQLPERKGGGLAWDNDGTGPDPFVRLYINGRKIWESPVQHDTRHPQWNVTLPRNIEVPREAAFRIELWDEDTASDDPAGVLVRSGLPDTALPGALAHLSLDNEGIVTVVVSDPHAYRGLGIEYEQHSDALVVLAVERYSPAARAGIKVGERIVAIDASRVDTLSGARAESELSLSADRGGTLKVANAKGKEREVTLDRQNLWLTM